MMRPFMSLALVASPASPGEEGERDLPATF
jgi:hypothetical protein